MRFLKWRIKWTLEGYYVFRKSIVPAFAPPELPEGLTFRRLDLESGPDLGALVSAWPPEWVGRRTPEGIARQVSRWHSFGDQCFALLKGDRVVTASWVSFAGSGFIDGFAEAYPLNDGEVLRRTLFVVPDFRGARLQLVQGRILDHHLATQQGITGSISYVGINNVASIMNSFVRSDVVTVIYHVCVIVPGFKWNWFPKRSSQRWSACRPK